MKMSGNPARTRTDVERGKSAEAHAHTWHGARMAYRTPEFLARYPIGKTKLWELIRDGVLTTRKVGSRTLVEAESAEAWWNSLPSHKGAA